MPPQSKRSKQTSASDDGLHLLASLKELIDDGKVQQLHAQLMVHRGHSGVNLNAQFGEGGDTLLTLAASTGQTLCLLALLAEPSIDVNAADVSNSTALELAVQSAHMDCVACLLPSKRDAIKMGDSLTYAVMLESPECVGQLLEGDVEIDDESFATAFKLARENLRDEACRMLMQDPRAATSFSLHEAVRSNLPSLLESLLETFIAPSDESDVKNNEVIFGVNAMVDGGTALMLAAELGHVACVKVLLADPQINVIMRHPESMLTAHEVAMRHNRFECVSLILQHPELVLRMRQAFDSDIKIVVNAPAASEVEATEEIEDKEKGEEVEATEEGEDKEKGEEGEAKEKGELSTARSHGVGTIQRTDHGDHKITVSTAADEPRAEKPIVEVINLDSDSEDEHVDVGEPFPPRIDPATTIVNLATKPTPDPQMPASVPRAIQPRITPRTIAIQRRPATRHPPIFILPKGVHVPRIVRNSAGQRPIVERPSPPPRPSSPDDAMETAGEAGARGTAVDSKSESLDAPPPKLVKAVEQSPAKRSTLKKSPGKQSPLKKSPLKRYSCPAKGCDRTYSSKGGIDRHWQTCHNDPRTPPTKRPRGRPPTRMSQCCGYKFHPNDLKLHVCDFTEAAFIEKHGRSAAIKKTASVLRCSDKQPVRLCLLCGEEAEPTKEELKASLNVKGYLKENKQMAEHMKTHYFT